MIYTRPATVDDAAALRVRAAEVDEIMAATGGAPAPAIVASVGGATEAWATFIRGELACVWGVTAARGASLLGARGGWVWLLTTDAVQRFPKAFWQLCLVEIPRLLERWDELWNHIDARHAQALRWARRLGFRLEEPRPYGALGLPFCRFVVTRKDLRCA